MDQGFVLSFTLGFILRFLISIDEDQILVMTRGCRSLHNPHRELPPPVKQTQLWYRIPRCRSKWETRRDVEQDTLELMKMGNKHRCGTGYLEIYVTGEQAHIWNGIPGNRCNWGTSTAWNRIPGNRCNFTDSLGLIFSKTQIRMYYTIMT